MPVAIRRPPSPLIPACAAAFILAAAGGGGAAFGQDYRGGGGTLLDRNQQIGSNGVNAKSADIRDRIWLNNQIITGNAPAGKSFRGYVGYTAPATFRGYAGSDTNYGFRRDSTSAGQVQTGVRASDALRYQFSLTTGQSVPAYLSAVTYTPRDANAATASAATSTSAALRSTADYLSSRALRPAFVGTKVDKYGNEYNAVASPLLGLNYLKINDEQPGAAKKDEKASEKKDDFAVPDKDKERIQQQLSRYTMTPSGLEAESQGLKRRKESAGKGLSDITSADSASSESASRAVMHTRFLDSVSDSYTPAEPPRDITTKPPEDKNDKAAKGEDDKPKSVAELELERLSRIMRGLPANPPPKEKKPGEIDDTKPGAKSAKESDNKKPSTEPTKKPDETDENNRTSKPLPPELLKALKTAGGKNIDSLAPGAGTTDPEWYRVQMADGQSMLEAQRYFDAEDRFTRAIGAMPNDPMAKVGRVHAQLGAGLFLSASANLRALLTAHPEMVAANYEAKLLPSPERCRAIAGLMRDNIAKGGQGVERDTGLLLAYLGHLTNDRAMCAEGLKSFGDHLDKDNAADTTFNQLLRGVWLGEDIK